MMGAFAFGASVPLDARRLLATELTDANRTSVITGTHIDLLDAMEHVDDRVGEPVMLRDLLGMDYAEIAELLDIPVGTVKSRIHEGRASLQRLLGR